MNIAGDAAAEKFLRKLFAAAIASADPFKVLPSHLPDKPKGRCIVVGAGKASAAMAAALEQAWPDVKMSGVVVTRYGHAVPTQQIKIIEAAHPVPDANSLLAAGDILNAVTGLSADDLVIALISGGGSALMVSPADVLTLADKQAVNRALLQSGAGIGEMNTVRKHLSRIKGGKLAAAAAPARVVTLLISDVPGDDPAIIASGPTVLDHTTPSDALAIIERYKCDLPQAVKTLLQKPLRKQDVAPQSDIRMIASPDRALRAAATEARSHGITPLILGDALEGEARELGIAMAGIAAAAQQQGYPQSTPCVILSGGETTVTIQNGKAGRGGRNTEFLLSTAIALQGRKKIWALAGDTDGIDGTEDAAGAVIGPDFLSRARHAGLEPRQFLTGHDSYSLFQALNSLVVTGPTLTNVNDFRALLVLPPA
jgi:glycerate 2-kinase